MIPEQLKYKLREIIKKKDEELARVLKEYSAYGYARLSREDEDKEKGQESSSIIRQRNILADYGINLDFLDDGKSGGLDEDDVIVYRKDNKLIAEFDLKKRPAFCKLLEQIEKGKGVFAVTNWDRWGRNLIAQEITLLYAKKKDCYVLSIEEGNELINRMVLGMVAQSYVETQSNKMNNSATVKYKLGLYNGSKMYGYEWVKHSGFQTLFPKNDKDTDLIRKLFKMALQGHTVNEIKTILNLEYDFVKRNLKNPYHCGLIENPDKKGQYKKGIHYDKAIISIEEFNTIQKKIGNPQITFCE